ncbi:hypothetical protein E2C01_069762 [Portunus trituberculatus]|uniref:Uncharacterized protein n=1 Tax=Portunus trituberculatus TaxID=210409 RepID=A0A5B7I0A3_PORTR|nr:hypothetical protein [Portunus trituberculatus]
MNMEIRQTQKKFCVTCTIKIKFKQYRKETTYLPLLVRKREQEQQKTKQKQQQKQQQQQQQQQR